MKITILSLCLKRWVATIEIRATEQLIYVKEVLLLSLCDTVRLLRLQSNSV